jgi:hypothetical protein
VPVGGRGKQSAGAGGRRRFLMGVVDRLPLGSCMDKSYLKDDGRAFRHCPPSTHV